VIAVHRISQPEHELYVNPDLIQVVEANPDTVLALVNGVRLVVIESPGEVAQLVREWRVAILTDSHQPVVVADARASAGRLAPVVVLPQQTSQAD
jgi:flagellar protein FlbD